jgi:hypothetical protein
MRRQSSASSSAFSTPSQKKAKQKKAIAKPKAKSSKVKTEQNKAIAKPIAKSLKAIDWETDKLIVLQIFRGPVEAGHWASLIIDRTRPNQSLAEFADSLPTFSRNSCRDLQVFSTHRFQTMSLGSLLKLRCKGAGPMTVECARTFSRRSTCVP